MRSKETEIVFAKRKICACVCYKNISLFLICLFIFISEDLSAFSFRSIFKTALVDVASPKFEPLVKPCYKTQVEVTTLLDYAPSLTQVNLTLQYPLSKHLDGKLFVANCSLFLTDSTFSESFIRNSLVVHIPGNIFQLNSSCSPLFKKCAFAKSSKIQFCPEQFGTSSLFPFSLNLNLSSRNEKSENVEVIITKNIDLIRSSNGLKKGIFCHSRDEELFILFAPYKELPKYISQTPRLSLTKNEGISFEKIDFAITSSPSLNLQSETLYPSFSFASNSTLDYFKALHNSIERPYNVEYKETIFPDARVIEAALVMGFSFLPILEKQFSYEKVSIAKVSFPFSAAQYTLPSENTLAKTHFKLPLLHNSHSGHLEEKLLIWELFNGKGLSSSSRALLSESMRTNRLYRFTQDELLHIPTLENLNTESLADEFTTTVRIATQMSKEGFIFSLQLSPQNSNGLETLPHRVYYILDKSSSVEKSHFEALKKGIAQSLHYLDPDAYFNVITLDQEVKYLSTNDLRATNTSIQFMQRALQKVDRGRPVNLSTLIDAFTTIKAHAEETKEVYTVVLVSNGQLMKNIRLNREALGQFIHNLPSTLSLFTVTAGEQNNLEMLDVLARLGRGNLVYSNTYASFPRKLSVLMKKLKKPLATDVCITNLKETNATASLFRDLEFFTPIFYAEKPYIVLGTCKNLEPTDIFIQGYQQKQWMNIRHKATLRDAVQGNQQLEKELAKQKALREQVRYLLTNDPSALLEAQKILLPFDQKTLYRQ